MIFFIGGRELKAQSKLKYNNLLRIKGPQKFIRSNRPRNFCGSLSQKFLWTVVPEISVDPCLRNFCRWVVVSEISTGESLSQNFLRVSRCQRNFCGSWKLYFLSCVFVNVLQTSYPGFQRIFFSYGHWWFAVTRLHYR